MAEQPDLLTPGGVITRRSPEQTFEVHLEVFSGPFDLLLGLIAKHKLDITEVAIATVTDEFIAHIRAQQAADTEWDLGQATEFLLVASTLLDLKASRLLPNAREDDEEDLALIEARDLLFARLLQYRAFKDVAAHFGATMATTGRMTPRQAGLEPLEVQQGRRDEHELAGLRQVPVDLGLLGRPQVRHELVGDLGQGDLGDVQLVLGDQAQEQLEGPGEDVEVNLEATPVAGEDPAGSRLPAHL